MPKITVPNNIGAMRYVLAYAVAVAHFNLAFGTHINVVLGSYPAVCVFFALSGFLVFSSWESSRGLGHYLRRRAARILPPYVTVVVLCTALLWTVSTLGVGEYFGSAHTWGYLGANLSFLNFLQPTLPGVFQANPVPAVNSSLWTLKIEWCLYLSVPVLVWLIRRMHGRATVLLVAVYVLSGVYREACYTLYAHTGREIYGIMGRQFAAQMLFFVSGILLYLHSGRALRYKWWLIGASGAVLVVGHLVPIPAYNSFVHPLAVSTFFIMLCFTGRWGAWLRGRNNVSYDVYLYHFPVMQVCSALGLLRVTGSVWTALAVCLALTTALAAASWYWIGRRFVRG